MSNYIPPIRFHQLRQEETFKSVAQKYGVDESKLRRENPEVKESPGEIVVISFRN